MKRMSLDKDVSIGHNVSHLHIILVPEIELLTLKNAVVYPSETFNMLFKSEWLNDKLLRDAISDIDHKDIADNEDVVSTLKSKYYITPKQLSTGFKNIALCYKCDYINRLSRMGANCFPFLVKVAEMKEVTLAMESYIALDDACFANTLFRINDDPNYYNVDDFNIKLIDIIDEEGIIS